MTLRYFIYILLCLACTFSFSSCSDDSGSDAGQSVMEHDWMLEGRWNVNDKYPDSPFTASVIQFNADGSGFIDDDVIGWHTHDGILSVRTGSGRKTEGRYAVSGATLSIEGVGSYTGDFPVTGTWYAHDAMSVFGGNTFCYHFNKNGEGIKYTFDYIGLTAKTNFKWNRCREGVSIIYRYATEDKTCVFSDDMMHIDGEGTFTSALPFYGEWKAIDCEKGLISEGDDNYSTLEITGRDNENSFICNYRINDGEKVNDAVFQGDLKIITSHQQIYNDQQLFIIQDVNGGGDAQVMQYRFFYYPPRKKVYLDLSSDFNTKRFVRYELM